MKWDDRGRGLVALSLSVDPQPARWALGRGLIGDYAEGALESWAGVEGG